MPDESPQAEPFAEFDAQPPLASVETDRFCDGCGYNLRTQPIRREPRTAVLLCRCPECGRFHPARDATTAGNLWLRRLAALLLGLWIVLLIAGGLTLGGLQIGFTYITLDEFTTYSRVGPVPAPPPIVTTSQGSITIVTTPAPNLAISGGGGSTWKLEVIEDYEHRAAFVALMHAISFFWGLLLALLLVLSLLHWPRWTYLIPVLFVSLAAAAIVWFAWRDEAPYLLDWGTPYILSQAAAHLAGGLTGILFGRRLARLVITLMLPPRVRQHLAFLWLVDGKQPPRMSTGGN